MFHRYRGKISQVSSILIDAYGSELDTVCWLSFLFSPLLFFVLIFTSPLTFFVMTILVIHSAIFAKASAISIRKEEYPYGVLRSEEILSKTTYGSTLLLFVSIGIVAIIDPLMIEPPIYQPLMLMSAMTFFIAASVLTPSFLLAVAFAFRYSYHKESRLCFRLVLSILDTLLKSKPEATRKLVTENARWFKAAFHSLNSFLISRPLHLELKDIDNYHDAMYTVALVGDSAEIEQTRMSIESILNSMGERTDSVNLRHVLIASHRLVQKKPDENVTAIELSNMWHMSTLTERTKSRLRSPMASFIATLIFGFLAVLVQIIFR